MPRGDARFTSSSRRPSDARRWRYADVADLLGFRFCFDAMADISIASAAFNAPTMLLPCLTVFDFGQYRFHELVADERHVGRVP